MGIQCRIIRNKEGKVSYVEAPNGNRSKLYDDAVAKVGEESALDIVLTAYTPSFTEEVKNPRIAEYRKQLIDKINSIPSNLSSISINLNGINLSVNPNTMQMVTEDLGNGETLITFKADVEAKTGLAPNGNSSNLNPKQYAEVRTPEFMAWSNDWNDVIKDENGEPQVHYHGTVEDRFTEFNSGIGIEFFTPFKKIAIGYAGFEQANPDSLYEVYVKSPKTFDPKAEITPEIAKFIDKNWKAIKDETSYLVRTKKAEVIEMINDIFKNEDYSWEIIETPTFMNFLRENGYTGIRTAEQGGKNIGIFNNRNVKSAEENTGSFSQETSDIRFSLAVHDDSGFITPESMVDIVSANNPAYLASVINHIATMSDKLRNGDVGIREIAKAYLISVSSTISSAQSIKSYETRTGRKVNKTFVSNGQIRPESGMAFFLQSKDGKVLLDKLENEGITREDLEPMLSYVKPFGVWSGEGGKVNSVFHSNTGINLKNLNEIAEILQKGIGNDTELFEAVGKLSGISEGKIGFVSQFLGIGTRGVVDAREISAWLTGKNVNSSELTPTQKQMKKDLLSATSKKGKLLREEIFRRMEEVASQFGIPKEFAQYLGHHMIWDAIGNEQTTHEEIYNVMRDNAPAFDSGITPKLKEALESAIVAFQKKAATIYSANFVDSKALLDKYGQVHPNAHATHSTIEFRPKSTEGLPLGENVDLKITGRLTTDKVDVLLVNNPLSKNKNPHITLSTAQGVMPKESNTEIENNLDKIEPLNDTITSRVDTFEGSTKTSEEALQNLADRLLKAGIAREVKIVSEPEIKTALEQAGHKFQQGINGFVLNDIVYINKDRAGLDTPIHEFGHLWNSWMQENAPEVYKRGIELIKSKDGQKYIDYVRKTQPKLEGEAIYEEALAEAIGDSGAKLTESAKTTFGAWLNDLWNSLRDALGLAETSLEEFQNLTLGEFTERAATDLLSGTSLAELMNSQAGSVGATFAVKPNANMQPSVLRKEFEYNVDFVSPVEKRSLSDVIEEYEGRVLVITSDATGVGYDSNGDPIYGGVGYSMITENIDGKVGFASLNAGTAKTAMRKMENQYGKGKKIAVFVMVQNPSATVGNYYGAKYFGRGLKRIKAEDPALFDLVVANFQKFLNNKTIDSEFKKRGKEVLEEKEHEGTIKDNEAANQGEQIKLDLIDLIRNVDRYTESEFSQEFIKDTTFNARREILKGLIAESATKGSDKWVVTAALRARGFNRMDFFQEYADNTLFTKEMYEQDRGGFIVSGFEYETPQTEEEFEALANDTQKRGLEHPQFNGKVPATGKRFVLDGMYDANDVFMEHAKPYSGVNYDYIGVSNVAKMVQDMYPDDISYEAAFTKGKKFVPLNERTYSHLKDGKKIEFKEIIGQRDANNLEYTPAKVAVDVARGIGFELKTDEGVDVGREGLLQSAAQGKLKPFDLNKFNNNNNFIETVYNLTKTVKADKKEVILNSNGSTFTGNIVNQPIASITAKNAASASKATETALTTALIQEFIKENSSKITTNDFKVKFNKVQNKQEVTIELIPVEAEEVAAEYKGAGIGAFPRFSIGEDLTQNRFSSMLMQGQWGMLTGENPDAKQLSPEENTKRNKEAKDWLEVRGYETLPIKGKYGNEENSFFVPNLTQQDALDFAIKFGQDSVATSKGLVYRTGEMNPRNKREDSQGGTYEDNFSTIEFDGKPFSYAMGYDFSVEVDAGKLEIKTVEQIDIETKTIDKGHIPHLYNDGEGNYVFYHYSYAERDSIEPKKAGSNPSDFTSSQEMVAVNRVGGLSMFYTKPEDKESKVGNYGHLIKVPMEKVYDINKDTDGFLEQARENFRKKYKDAAFDPNNQIAFITQLAIKAGYDMAVANWTGGKYRAQSTKSLKPSEKEIIEKNVVKSSFTDYSSGKPKFSIGFMQTQETPQGTQVKLSNVEDQAQGKGVGTEMYKQAAKKSVDSGSSLVSDNNSKGAEGVWNKFRDAGVVEPTTVNDSVVSRIKTTPDSFDVNGEPNISDVIQFIQAKNYEGQTLSDVEINEVKNSMLGTAFESSDDLFRALKRGFTRNGMYNPSEDSLVASGLYSQVEARRLLDSEEAQLKAYEIMHKIKNSDTIPNVTEIDSSYITIISEYNSLGMLKKANPFLNEKTAKEVLGGIKDETLFSNQVDANNLEFAATKFEELSKLTKVAKIKVDGISRIPHTNIEDLRVRLQETLTLPSDGMLVNNLDYLLEIPNNVWNLEFRNVQQLLTEIEKEAVDIGLDLSNLNEEAYDKTPDEVKSLLNSVRNFAELQNQSTFEVLLAEYVNFFNITESNTVETVDISEEVASKTLVYTATELDSYTMFTKYNLLPLGNNLYQKVNANKSLEETIDTVYQHVVAGQSVLPSSIFKDYDVTNIENEEFIRQDIENYATNVSKDVENSTSYDTNMLKKMVLFSSFFKTKLNNERAVPSVESEMTLIENYPTNAEYLTTEFIADFNKTMLKEKVKNSKKYNSFYKHFDILEKGIELVNTDPITMSEIQEYLTPDLINHFKLKKDGINIEAVNDAESEAVNEVALRNYYTNFPQALPLYKETYQMDNGILITNGTTQFIRVDEGAFEHVETIGQKSLYTPLNTNTTSYKIYSASLSVTPLGDISKFNTSQGVKAAKKINNLYNKKQGDELTNEIDNC